jgi:hypothetical protein
MEEKIVYPEDLHIEEIELIGKTSDGKEYKVKASICLESKQGYLNMNNFNSIIDNHSYLINENITHRKCENCGNPYKKSYGYYVEDLCPNCRESKNKEKEKEEYLKLEVETNPQYPIFMNDHFVNDEEDLEGFLDNCNTIEKVNDNFYYTTEEIKAPNIDLVDYLYELEEYSDGEGSSCLDMLGSDTKGRDVSILEEEINQSLKEMYGSGKWYKQGNKRININDLIDIKKLLGIKDKE